MADERTTVEADDASREAKDEAEREARRAVGAGGGTRRGRRRRERPADATLKGELSAKPPRSRCE
jgi:hypothetical protein